MENPTRTARQTQVIAMGGGGFSIEPANPVLDLYLLRQTEAARPRVCFVPTASGDAESYISNFYRAYSKLDCRPSHLTFFQRTPDLRALILNQDIIYVGGGNTKSMLAIWKDWGLDVLLKEAWQAGIVLTGISAGAICWFQQGITDSFADELAVLECLGLLEGSCCPHYDGEPERKPAFHNLLLKNRILPGLALDDGAAAHFVDGKICRIVASRPRAKGYQMRVANGCVEETALATELL